MSHWHTGTNRFALTTTVNVTTHNTRVINNNEWMATRANQSEYKRLDAPTSINLQIPPLLQKKNIPVLPRVGRNADEGACNLPSSLQTARAYTRVAQAQQ